MRSVKAWRDGLLLLATWLLLAWLVDPRGDFPLNDDWAYALPVESLVERGELRLTFWQSMPLLPQLAWGALFSLPAGFSFTALRLSTLTLGLVGVLATYACLRDAGAPARLCALGALCLLVNPVYLPLSYTFMSDVPFLALFVASSVWLLRALDRDTHGALFAGTALAAVATLIRQVGVLSMLAFVVAAWPAWSRGHSQWGRWWHRRWLVGAVLPAILVMAMLPMSRWLIADTVGLPALYDARDAGFRDALLDLLHLRLGVLRHVLRRMVLAALYMGLFLLPVVLYLGVAKARVSRRYAWWVGLGGAALALVLVTGGVLVPHSTEGNVLLDFGVGPRTLPGARATLTTPIPRIAITVVASFGACALGGLVIERVRALLQAPLDDAQARARYVVAALCIGFGPFALAYGAFFDRYLLFMIPMLLVLLLTGARPVSLSPRAFVPALLVGLGMGAFSAAATHDYLAWNRARWLAALAVAENAALDGQVDAGFEYNNWVESRRSLSQGVARHNLADRSHAPYAVSFATGADAAVVLRVPVAAWLPFSPREVVVVARQAADLAAPEAEAPALE